MCVVKRLEEVRDTRRKLRSLNISPKSHCNLYFQTVHVSSAIGVRAGAAQKKKKEKKKIGGNSDFLGNKRNLGKVGF